MTGFPQHTVSGVLTNVPRWAREVVARRAAIVAAFPALVTILAAFHISTGLSESVEHAIVAAIDLVALVLGVVYVRAGVTPADPALWPADHTGTPLVSALTVGPHAGKGSDDLMAVANTLITSQSDEPAPAGPEWPEFRPFVPQGPPSGVDVLPTDSPVRLVAPPDPPRPS